MREGCCKVVVCRALPIIQALRSARLVADIKARRGRDIMSRGNLKVFLTVTLLSRLQVCEVEIGSLRVVEWHVIHTVCIGVVRLRKCKIGTCRSVKIVECQGRLSQTAECHITYTIQVVRIIYSPVHQRGIQRLDIHIVHIAVDVPQEVRQRAN